MQVKGNKLIELRTNTLTLHDQVLKKAPYWTMKHHKGPRRTFCASSFIYISYFYFSSFPMPLFRFISIQLLYSDTGQLEFVPVVYCDSIWSPAKDKFCSNLSQKCSCFCRHKQSVTSLQLLLWWSSHQWYTPLMSTIIIVFVSTYSDAHMSFNLFCIILKHCASVVYFLCIQPFSVLS